MKVDEKALEIIDKYGRADGSLFYIEKALPRKEYLLVNAVLESLGENGIGKGSAMYFQMGLLLTMLCQRLLLRAVY